MAEMTNSKLHKTAQELQNIIKEEEKIIDFLNNEENKKDFADYMEQQYLNRIAKEKELIANFNYINWLEKFTETHPNFADDTWLYAKNEIPGNDYSNVNKLSSFFSAIERYCREFLIETDDPTASFPTNITHIKHNDIGYEIGLVVGQGAYAYVLREEISEKSIDFSAIMNNTPPKSYEEKTTLLKNLDSLLSALKEKDVPTENIASIIQKHYN